MKMNKLFAAAMAATLMFASCTEDNGAGNGGAPVAGDETYAGVKITLPVQTRAEDENASPAESAINTVGVYIIDRATNVIHSAILDTDDFGVVEGVVTATTAVKTTTGMKDVFVIANPTAGILGKIASMRKPAFLNTIQTTLGLDETHFYTENLGALTSMVMTGQRENYDMTAVVSSTAALTDAKMLKLTIERNTSKVVLKAKETMVVDGGTATDINFAMAAKNTDSYLSYLMTEDYGTPHNAVPTSAEDNSADAYYNFFTSITPATYKPIVAHDALKTAANGFYVLENQTTTSPKREGNTTAVVIKLKYTPTKAKGSKIIGSWAAGVATEGDLGVDGSFYVYTGGDNSYWSEAAYTAATTAEENPLPTSAFSAKYAGGLCYYKIYVVATQDGAKEVLRNNYYEMTLAQVKGPGKPSPDTGIEPKTPIEDDTWLGLELSVKKWSWSPTEWTIQ